MTHLIKKQLKPNTQYCMYPSCLYRKIVKKTMPINEVLNATGFSAKKIWVSLDHFYLGKLIRFYAHYLWFNFIPRSQEKPDVSLTTIGIRLGEYLNNIPRLKISSTNLILQYHSMS